MRQSNQCTKCGSRAIGHIERRYEDMGDSRIGFTTQVLGVMGSRTIGVGPLEAYVCTTCGYLETYVIAPDTVQFESIRGFKWVNEPNPQQGGFR